MQPASAKHSQEHGGKTYYFCCAGCKEKFKAEPAKYLNRPSGGTAMIQIAPSPMPRCRSKRRYLQQSGQLRRRELRVPHVSRGPCQPARTMPEVRHGSRT